MSQSTILIGEAGFGIESIRALLPGNYRVCRYDDSSALELQVQPESGAWYIRFFDYKEASDLVGDYLEDSSIGSEIKLRILGASFVGVEYNSFLHFREVLVRIASERSVIIDTTEGQLMTETEFLKQLKANPEYDWRKA